MAENDKDLGLNSEDRWTDEEKEEWNRRSKELNRKKFREGTYEDSKDPKVAAKISKRFSENMTKKIQTKMRNMMHHHLSVKEWFLDLEECREILVKGIDEIFAEHTEGVEYGGTSAG